MADLKPHDELVEKAKRFLKSFGCGFVAGDPFNTPLTKETPDAIGWYNGLSFLIECKVSRSDFLADAKKDFRINPEKGMGDWRFYMCPENVISPDELPDGWGLIWIKGNRVTQKFNFPSNMNYHTKKPFTGNKKAESIYLAYAAKSVKTASQDHIQQLEADKARLEVELQKKNALLKMDEPYCLPDVLKHLTFCADKLLDADGYNYQKNGWEILDLARKQAKKHLELLKEKEL